MERGFSIIEMLIAMTIGVTVLSAVAVAAFGNQMSLTNEELGVSVASRAQALLGLQESLAQTDINLVNPTTTNAVFQTSATAELLPDLVSKRVTVSATLQENPAITTTYSTLVTNLENVGAPDTCDSALAGDWSHPHISNISLQALLATSSGVFTVSDVDVYLHKLYIAIESTAYKTDPTLLVVDVTNPSLPTLLGVTDNASTTSGLAAARVAEDHVAHKMYVYGANAGSFAKGQLQIFDVTDPVHPGFPLTYKIPTMYVSSAGNGKSIYYKDGYVYMGLTTAPGIVEFHIIDVRDKLNPQWRGGYAVGSGVEAIIVKKNRAYVATDDNAREFATFDVSNAAAPTLLSTFNAAGSIGSGFGRSIGIVGTTAYLGRTWVLNNNTPELYVLDVSNPTSFAALAARDIGTSSNPFGVYGVLVRSNLAFILTKSSAGGQLQIIDIGSPGHVASESQKSIVNLPSGFGGTAMDCEQNTIYIGSTDAAGDGMLSIVGPG